MRSDPPNARFWSGPIINRQQAVTITRVAGLVVASVGIAFLLITTGTVTVHGSVVSAVFLLSGAFLIVQPNRLSAAITLSLVGLVTVSSVLGPTIVALTSGVQHVALAAFLVALVSLPAAWLQMRAFRAALALQRGFAD